jgi:hypothetical protein
MKSSFAPEHAGNAHRLIAFPKSVLASLIAIAGMIFFVEPNWAGSATWVQVPETGYWNSASNWTPATVPDGPTDIATFGPSDQTYVTVGADTEVNALVFESDADAFTLVPTTATFFTLSGAGITNNSSRLQRFVIGGSGQLGIVQFTGSAVAGTSTLFTAQPNGNVWFSGSSSAGQASFINQASTATGGTYGSATFFEGTTAGAATFLNDGCGINESPGGATFFDAAFAGNAIATNNGGRVAGANGGSVQFTGGSAENGTFINNGGTISGAHGGSTTLFQETSAANAIFIANGGTNGGEGGTIVFRDSATGDTAQFKIYGNGDLDVSAVTDVSIGSLVGDGFLKLGSCDLSIGANNLNTVFSGTYSGDGLIEKIGSGTLTFSGIKALAVGPTMVSDGVLQVTHDNALATGDVTVNAGATLRLQGGMTNDYLADGATLHLVTGTIAHLNFTGSPDRVLGLTIDGIAQDPGLYGGAGSGADHILPEFTGAGTILVGASSKSRLLNISTRLQVQTGDNVLIGGFILVNGAPKTVLIRGLGPSLASMGVPGALMDPTLDLVDAFGGLIATNDDWKDTQEAEIIATGIPPSDDRESAIVQQLVAGTSYTAILRGKDDSTGVGLVEVYDLDSNTDSSIANISTRGLVQTGDDVMIGGIIVGPDDGGSAALLVRAIGPSLADAQVANPLPDPVLSLRDVNGTELALNDDWKEAQENLIASTGIPPSDDRESALFLFLTPGNYTAIVSGKDGETGVALVEFYNVQ